MKKLFILLIILLLLAEIAGAESIIKLSVTTSYGKVEELRFLLPSVELKFEQSLYKNVGLGVGIRKETSWLYYGYYFSLYPYYKIKLEKEKGFITSALGIDYGLPATSEYSLYTHTEQNRKWIRLNQNVPLPFDALRSGNTGVLYPFISASYGKIVKIVKKKVPIEVGQKIQFLKFDIKSYNFSSGERNNKKLIITPAVFIQVGWKI